MTEAHRGYFNAMPASFRNRQNEPLGRATTLTHIVCDDVEGRGIRYTDPVARICYSRGEAGGGGGGGGGARPLFITLYLTKDGKAAHLSF